MSALFGITGIVGFAVCLLILIINAIARRPKKTCVFFLGVFFLCFIVGLIIPTEPQETELKEVSAGIESVRQFPPAPAADAKPGRTPAPKETEQERIEREKAEKDDYIAGCKEIAYKKLLRNPDDYKGTQIVLTVKISQVLSGWFSLGDTAYHCYTDESGHGWYFDDEYYIADKRVDKSLKLLEDDIIKIYGEYDGIENVTRAIGLTNVEVPRVSMRYVELIEE